MVGFILSRLALSGLSCTLGAYQPRSYEGRKISVTHTFKNMGSIARNNVVLNLNVRNTTQGLEQEEQWLIPPLHGSKTLHLDVPFNELKRGINILETPRLQATDPLGLFQSEREVSFRARIIVYPKPLWDDESRIPSALDMHRLALLSRRNDPLEYREVREYQAGDDLRLVHPRSSAKRGMLMVRTPEQQTPIPLILIIDVDSSAHGRWNEVSTLEYALRLASSMVTLCTRSGVDVQIVTSDGRTSHGSERTCLEHLARVSTAAQGSTELIPININSAINGQDAAACLLITPRLSALTIAHLTQLNMRGTQTTIVLLKNGHTSEPNPAAKNPLPDGIEILSAGSFPELHNTLFRVTERLRQSCSWGAQW